MARKHNEFLKALQSSISKQHTNQRPLKLFVSKQRRNESRVKSRGNNLMIQRMKRLYDLHLHIVGSIELKTQTQISLDAVHITSSEATTTTEVILSEALSIDYYLTDAFGQTSESQRYTPSIPPLSI
jgi:hypothetical protein